MTHGSVKDSQGGAVPAYPVSGRRWNSAPVVTGDYVCWLGFGDDGLCHFGRSRELADGQYVPRHTDWLTAAAETNMALSLHQPSRMMTTSHEAKQTEDAAMAPNAWACSCRRCGSIRRLVASYSMFPQAAFDACTAESPEVASRGGYLPFSFDDGGALEEK